MPGAASSAGVALCRLDQLGQVGPDRRDVWDGFRAADSVTAYPMVENHDTDVMRRLAVEPNKYLSPLVEPRAGRRLKPLNQLWQQAGQLLIAERLWLNSTRIIAMRSDTPVLSNVWWPVKTEWDKPLAVWLNSSLGILALLSHRTSTRGSWVALKKADLEELPVLDAHTLTPDQLQALSALFDELAEMEFERLPDMRECPARRALDDGLSAILSLPDLSRLREWLATAPVVANRRL